MVHQAAVSRLAQRKKMMEEEAAAFSRYANQYKKMMVHQVLLLLSVALCFLPVCPLVRKEHQEEHATAVALCFLHMCPQVRWEQLLEVQSHDRPSTSPPLTHLASPNPTSNPPVKQATERRCTP